MLVSSLGPSSRCKTKQEGQHHAPLQVHQEHVHPYTWHIKNVVTIMVMSLGSSTRCTLRSTTHDGPLQVCQEHGRQAPTEHGSSDMPLLSSFS